MASKTTTKPKTTPAAAPELVDTPADKAPTRTELLAALADRGYAGPTSFTASTLRTVLAWVDADCPRDAEGIPAGVLFATHPDLRPTRAVRRVGQSKYQQGYQAAMEEIAALGKDLRAIQAWVADNRVTVDA